MNPILHLGDSLSILPTLPDASVDAIVTDPPYELGFMGKAWDKTGIAVRPDVWRECLRVLKPGGYLLAFGGSRTFHRITCAIEDAGFEIRDTIMWLYGSGFPKSLDVSKAIDKAAGKEREIIGTRTVSNDIRGGNLKKGEAKPLEVNITAPATDEAKQWEGWGTALKPAFEPIIVARKPLIGTVAQNVLQYGTGAINIDACRVAAGDDYRQMARENPHAFGGVSAFPSDKQKPGFTPASGRFPANVIHDGSEEVLEAFDQFGTKTSGKGAKRKATAGRYQSTVYGRTHFEAGPCIEYGDSGSAARFFYCAKASPSERAGNPHPTVKPIALMRYLIRLVTPPGGIVLDPFMGSGSTGVAAMAEGFYFIGIEKEPDHYSVAVSRIVL